MSHPPDDSFDRFRQVLGNAGPSAEVERLIVSGALRRLRSRRRQRRTIWAAVILSGAAAAAVLVLWLAGLVGHAPVPAGREDLLATRPAGRPAPGALWTTTSRQLTVTMGDHLARMGHSARLRWMGGTLRAPRLEVLVGRVLFSVKPLGKGESFTVRTKQVEARVLGTRFAVAVRPPCTSIEVEQGVVGTRELHGGESRRLAGGDSRMFCEASPVAQLGRGGRLVRDAQALLHARKDLHRAADLLKRYLAQFPDGPLAEEALFGLIMVHREQDRHAEARDLARVFLKRFSGTPRAHRLRRWLQQEGSP